MRLVGGSLVLCLIPGLISGCQIDRVAPVADERPAVVVVDVDVVAKAIGRDIELQQRLTSAREQIKRQLSDYAEGLNAQLSEQLEALRDDVDPEKRQALKRTRLLARRAVQTSAGRAEDEIRRYRQALIQQFRDQLAPIAATTAQRQGAALVLSARPDALWFAPDADITDEVIAELRAHPLPKPPPVRVMSSRDDEQGVSAEAADTQDDEGSSTTQ